MFQHFHLSCISFIGLHFFLLIKQELPLFGCSASTDLSREKLHAVNGNYSSPGREFLLKNYKKNNKTKQLPAVVCSSVIQRTEGEKLSVVFKEIRQDYKQLISS